MGTNRIIIADTDETVISALENTFISALKDSAELEIITDRAYFQSLFSTSQNADILACGEELYTSELKKHDIKHFFLLCEENREKIDSGSDVERVNKYSNPAVILKQITRKITDQTVHTNDAKPLLVVVSSASGGVGKTNIAISLCGTLANDFKRVLYIDAERINTFQHFLKTQSAIPNSIVSDISGTTENLYGKIKHVIKKMGFDYLPPFNVDLSSLGISPLFYDQLAVSAKKSGDYDVVVVDTDNAFDELKAKLLTHADKVLMVVNQTRASVFAMNTFLSNISYNDATKYFFVCNALNPEKSNCLLNGDIKPKFVVSENIAYVENEEELYAEKASARADIKKTAYLVV